MSIDVSKFGKGGLVKPITRKDYRFELLATAVSLPKSFELNYGGKIKNQDGSGSCVSQAVSYYATLLNYIETGEWIELSARDLYSLVYLDPMGSYIKDNMQKVKNSGIVLELDAPSYDNGNPPSEAFMRSRKDITEAEAEKGKTYIAKDYFTWDNTNIDLFKQAILQGSGCIVVSWGNNYCWSSSKILLPDNKSQMVWRHGIYFIGWDDATKLFKFINSWGEGWGDRGYGYLPYDYITKGYVSNPMTMIDVPNNTYIKLMSQIKNLQEMIRIQILINKLKELIKKLLNIK
jgi:C1A family cysteine protease